MNKRMLSVVMALPLLTLGTSQTFASNRAVKPSNFNTEQFTVQPPEIPLDAIPPQSLLTAARGEDTEACKLLGLCDKRYLSFNPLTSSPNPIISRGAAN